MKNTRYENDFRTRASEWIGDMTVWLRENEEIGSEQRERLTKNLRKAIKEELTPRQRQLVELYFFQNRSMYQIAKELGLHVSTVSRTIIRAKKRIQHCLKYSF